MTIIDDIALPGFEPGERVRLHFREVEYKCPACGVVGFIGNKRLLGMSSLITILRKSPSEAVCNVCGSPITVDPDCWYEVETEVGSVGLAPYTVLEKLEE